MNKSFIYLFILVTITIQAVFAQNSNRALHLTPTILSSSGFKQEGSKGLHFSVGALKSVLILSEKDSIPHEVYPDTTEVSYKHNGSISKNLQYKKPVTNSEFKTSNKSAEIEVYPNPLVDRVTLFIENFNTTSKENYHFGLLDIAGNTLITDRIERGENQILLNTLAKGIYFLILYKEGEQLKSFKLIKNNL